MQPSHIKGNVQCDDRVSLFYKNICDCLALKGIYMIENSSLEIRKCWQDHKTEKHWLSAMHESFCVQLMKIYDWYQPSKNLVFKDFIISNKKYLIYCRSQWDIFLVLKLLNKGLNY